MSETTFTKEHLADAYARGEQCGYDRGREVARAEADTSTQALHEAYSAGEQCGYDRGHHDGSGEGYDKGYEEAMARATDLTQELIERLQ